MTYHGDPAADAKRVAWGEWEWQRCDHHQPFYRTKSVSEIDEFGVQRGLAYPYCDTCGSSDITRPVIIHFSATLTPKRLVRF